MGTFICIFYAHQIQLFKFEFKSQNKHKKQKKETPAKWKDVKIKVGMKIDGWTY